MSVIRIMKKFGTLMSSRQKLRIAELAILMIIGGLLEMCSVSLVLPFMNAAMNPESAMDKWYVRWLCGKLHLQSGRSFLVAVAAALAVMYVIKNVYLLAEFNIQYRFVYGNMFAMQQRLLRNFMDRPYEFFLKVNSGEIIQIVNSDTPAAFNLLTTVLNLFTELVVSGMLAVTVFFIAPKATLGIAVLMGALLVTINRAIKPLMQAAGRDNQKAGANLNKWLLQSIHGIKELKVTGREDYFQSNYDKYGAVYVSTLRKNQVFNIMPRFFIEAVSMSSMFVLVAVMIYRGSDLETIIPVLSAVAMAAIRLLPSVNRISASLANMAYYESRLDKLMENLESIGGSAAVLKEGLGCQYSETEQNGNHVPCLQNVLKFHRITYGYPDSDGKVLLDASMTIHKGESIGIIGMSGAGKTTSVDILLGLLQPEEGQVLADGVDIRRDIKKWMSQIGYIPQMIFLLDDSIRANVAFGIQEDEVPDKRVWRALEEASLADFVRSLPHGLDTQIGERGVRLSGGQRQRIGIARALYRNPEILIFDEATSALDYETENAIMDSIHSLHGQKTMVIIAHRYTTIEGCDHVYQAEDKKMIMKK